MGARPVWKDGSTLSIDMQDVAMGVQLAGRDEGAGREAEVVRRLEEDSLNCQIVAQGGARGTPGQ